MTKKQRKKAKKKAKKKKAKKKTVGESSSSIQQEHDRQHNLLDAKDERLGKCTGMSVASDEMRKIHPFGKW